MVKAILITQCLQNDFVEPIKKYDPLPNMLHVGYSEALRLMGENISDSPVNQVIRWAYSIPEQDLLIIHIRDWHDTSDNEHKNHLNFFGSHCIKNTKGAEFVFQNEVNSKRNEVIINASGLNDFIDTELEKILSNYQNMKIKVGVMGVWTEAKIQFLIYDIITRHPNFEVATCSALTASSSRAKHFIALEQIKKILGVNVFSSVGDFTSYLLGTMPQTIIKDDSSVELVLESDYEIQDIDKKIIQYLYRDCRKAELKSMDGGFSGNVVMRAKSIDSLGHKQVPTVIKIGQRELIAQERTSFERIQEVMGNNAPHIVESVELENRGGIKYRYASMLDSQVKTFQDTYESNAPLEDIFRYLDIIFKNQLGRLYEAEDIEKISLLEYYDFNPKYAPHVRKNIETLEGVKIFDDEIEIIKGIKVPNVCDFYEKDLALLSDKNYPEMHFMAFVHGDLNGKNIIIDGQSNVWLIDFFHTHRGHILKDLIKLENDVLYIFTKIKTEEDLLEAFKLTDLLIYVKDLGKSIVDKIEFKNPMIRRAYLTISKLRSYYPSLISWDREPYQLHVAILRYAMHTISFDECSLIQKKWALYTGAKVSVLIKNYLQTSRKIRVDYIDEIGEKISGRLGITILPGRKDKGRNIHEDINALTEQGIKSILCLLTELEFHEYGVDDLKKLYTDAGFNVYYFPILDQTVPRTPLLKEVLDWMEKSLKNKENLLIHCVGGLGRSGIMAALFLKNKLGFNPETAIELVRKARSMRAIETKEQESFVREY